MAHRVSCVVAPCLPFHSSFQAGDIALAGPSALSSGHQGYDMLVCDDGVGLLEDKPLYAHKGPTPLFQQWGLHVNVGVGFLVLHSLDVMKLTTSAGAAN